MTVNETQEPAERDGAVNPISRIHGSGLHSRMTAESVDQVRHHIARTTVQGGAFGSVEAAKALEVRCAIWQENIEARVRTLVKDLVEYGFDLGRVAEDTSRSDAQVAIIVDQAAGDNIRLRPPEPFRLTP